MRSVPLRFLLPGLILAVGLLVVGGSTWGQWRRDKEDLTENMYHQASMVGIALSGQIESGLVTGDRARVHQAIESVQGDRELVSALVVDEEGLVISASRLARLSQPLGDEQRERLQPHMREANQTGAPAFFQHDSHFHVIVPLQARSEGSLIPDVTAFLVLEYDMSFRQAALVRELVTVASIRTVIVFVLSLLVWYVFKQRLLQPVRTLIRAARHIGEGDFNTRIAVKFDDELGELADALRQMSQRLEHNTRQLSYQAIHDSLTGVLNRWGFERQLDQLLRGLPHDNRSHALVYLDLDQFRIINDTVGHAAGDEFIRSLVQYIASTLFVRDYLARVGGDEVAILLLSCNPEQAYSRAESLRDAIAEFRVHWNGQELRSTASIGVVPIYRGMPNQQQIFSLADAACYAAKSEGRNRIHLWKPGDQVLEKHHGELTWVNRIQQALEEDRFVLFAQPIVETDRRDGGGKLCYEVLVRMLDEKGEVVPPGQFLPVAERYQLASRIDRWVVRHVIRELEARPDHVNRLDFCSINLSGLSLTDSALLEEIAELVIAHPHVRPEVLCFEVTETAAITNLGRAAEFIDRMRAIGCRFALDDFGTGVSSFAYLKNLPVDFLKIDGVFVKDMMDDPIDYVVVEAIHNIGHEMGKITVAEFVENEAIRGSLSRIGVDLCQGFGIARPGPLSDLLDRK